jgi:hypothetical protein
MGKLARTPPLWTIKTRNGLMLWCTVGLCLTKRDAIAKVRKVTGKTWPQLKRIGHTAVRAALREVRTPAAGRDGRDRV